MLVDTSGLLCLFDAAEQRHITAVSLYRKAARRISHNYILAEFVILAQVRRIPRTRVLQYMTDLLDSSEASIIWFDEKLHRSAMKLLSDRLDKTYSLCDAVSFVIMRQHKISEALTTDRHFTQEGFSALLPS